MQWEGLVTREWPQELQIKDGSAIPAGDFVRDLLEQVAAARERADLVHAAKAAAFFGDALVVDRHDSRSMRMHVFDTACSKPCEERPYNTFPNSFDWKPQCLTERMRKSIFYRFGGGEVCDRLDGFGLC